MGCQASGGGDRNGTVFKDLRGRTLALMRQWDANDLKKTSPGPQGERRLDRTLPLLIAPEIGHRSQLLMVRRLKNPDR